MRTAFTVGVKKNGKAEIIAGPDVSVHTHRRDFHEITSKSSKAGYSEIQLWESGRGMRMRKRFGKEGDAKSGVNFNAAHPVDKQKDKKADLPDLTPKFGEKGGVNFNAALPVNDQAKPKSGKKTAKKAAKKSATKKPAAAHKPAKTGKAKLVQRSEPQVNKSPEPAAAEGPTL